MSPNHLLQRGLPLLIAALAALPFLQGCERRGGVDPAPTTSGGAPTTPGTAPGAMPPASAASR